MLFLGVDDVSDFFFDPTRPDSDPMRLGLDLIDRPAPFSTRKAAMSHPTDDTPNPASAIRAWSASTGVRRQSSVEGDLHAWPRSRNRLPGWRPAEKTTAIQRRRLPSRLASNLSLLNRPRRRAILGTGCRRRKGRAKLLLPSPLPFIRTDRGLVVDDDDEKIQPVRYVPKVQSSREDTIRDALERRAISMTFSQLFWRIVVPTEKINEIRTAKGDR